MAYTLFHLARYSHYLTSYMSTIQCRVKQVKTNST